MNPWQAAIGSFVLSLGVDFVVYRYLAGIGVHWALALAYLTTILWLQLARLERRAP